jgi:ribosomal protein S26
MLGSGRRMSAGSMQPQEEEDASQAAQKMEQRALYNEYDVTQFAQVCVLCVLTCVVSCPLCEGSFTCVGH